MTPEVILLIGLFLICISALVWMRKRRVPRRGAPVAPAGPTPLATAGSATLSATTKTFKGIGQFSTSYPKISAMIGYVLLLYVLVLAFFPESRGLLLSGPGIGLLLLAILGYTTFVIIRMVFWKDSWITAFILVLILALVLDMGIMRKISPEGREEIHARLADFWPFGGARCPGVAPTKPTVFSETSVPFNPNKCDTTYAVIRGCVKFDGPGGRREVCANGNVIGRRDYFILTDARASAGTAEMFYMLCPLGKGPEDGGWKCRS